MPSGPCAVAWTTADCAANCAKPKTSAWTRSIPSSAAVPNTTTISERITSAGTFTTTLAPTKNAASRNSWNCSASMASVRFMNQSSWYDETRNSLTWAAVKRLSSPRAGRVYSGESLFVFSASAATLNGGARLRRALISKRQKFGLDGVLPRQIPGKSSGRGTNSHNRRNAWTGESEKMISFLPSCDKRKAMKSLVLASALLFSATAASGAAEDWKPAQGRLMTRWAKDVSPKNAHPEYPRPQLVRKDWLNL